MNKILISALIAVSTSGLLPSAAAVNGKQINGRAVSVQWRFGWNNWAAASCETYERIWRGSIVLYTITGGTVAKADTIHKRDKGLAVYPTFDINGSRVAFYRFDKGVSAGACISANGGKNTLSVIDIDGKNLINLCDLPAEPPSEGGIDWPAGDWIYYVQVKSGTWGPETNEIWKVNVATHENVKVCAYTGQGNALTCSYFRRFSLNQSANRMAAQMLQRYQCTDTPWFCNDVVPFGPSSCNITAGSGNCNIAISASGNYDASFQASHYILVLRTTPGVTGVRIPPSSITLGTAKQWTTTNSFGDDAELIRWAANSDKWVLEQVGWYGHADETCYGSNQVAINWVDSATIRVSDNPKIPKSTAPGGDGTLYFGSCAGDMWVDGGPGTEGKYEGADGVWRSVTGPIAVAPKSSRMSGRAQILTSMRIERGTISLCGVFASSFVVEILDPLGRMTFRHQYQPSEGALRINHRPLSGGSYILRVVEKQAGAIAKKFVVQ